MIVKKRGVAFLWLILVSVISITAGAALPDTPTFESCEVIASPRARLLSRLIRISLERGDLNRQDLQSFIDYPDWSNPFSGKSKSPEVLSAKRAFEKTAGEVSLEEKASVKQELSVLTLKLANEASAVERAQGKTAPVIAPKPMHRLKVSGLLPDTMPYSVGWQNGRPIFVGRMETDAEKYKIVVFDPFHSDKNSRASVIEMHGNLRPSDGFGFFEKDGTPYAVDLVQPFIVDLNKREEVSRSLSLPTLHDSQNYFKFSVLVKSQSSVKQIGLLERDNKHQLVEIELLEPNAQPRVLAKKVTTTPRSLRVDIVRGKTIVTYASFWKIFVYDATEGRMIKEHRAHSFIESESSALVYEDQGIMSLAFIESVENRDHSKLRLLDLNSGKRSTVALGENLAKPGPIDVVNIDGVPYLYFFDLGLMYLVNLRTKAVEKFLVVKERTSARRFQFNGHEHLMWVTEDDRLNIFNFNTRTKIFQGRVLPDTIFDIFPVAYRGQIYGLAVLAHQKMPYLIRITAPGIDEVTR